MKHSTNEIPAFFGIKVFIFVFLIFNGCAKKPDIKPSATENSLDPAKSPSAPSGYTITTTTNAPGSTKSQNVSGEISTSGGGGSVTVRGVCYNTSPNPTTSNSTVTNGSGPGKYNCTLSGLTAGTTYYARAYGIKGGATSYGNSVSFTTLTLGMPSVGVGTVNDIDGHVYNTITLGTQVWMVENLRATHFNDGTSIPNLTSGTSWSGATSSAYCDYNNDPSNSVVYGCLYNMYTIKDSKKLAPAGWHIPSFNEFQTLWNYLGGGDTAAGRMKEAGTAHWMTPNKNADNSSGFTGLGAGHRGEGAFPNFYGSTQTSHIWTSSSSLPSSTIDLILDYSSGTIVLQMGSISGGATFGYSVRCIKD